jgi:hypothetical protein
LKEKSFALLHILCEMGVLDFLFDQCSQRFRIQLLQLTLKKLNTQGIYLFLSVPQYSYICLQEKDF